MKLTDNLPVPVTWSVRIICWVVSLAIIFKLFSLYANMRTVHHIEICLEIQNRTGKGPATSLDTTRELLTCLDGRSGLPEKLLYASAKKAILSLPSVPFKYVGIWNATRADKIYRVTLKNDSQFIAEPLSDGAPGSSVLSGSWGARDGKMIWLYDEGRIWPPDINPITDISDTSFSLRESDGSTTRYELVERVPASSAR